MPGKVNPVIPEAVLQATMQVMGNDQIITQACGSGNLELNPFMPVIANALLENLSLLKNACSILNNKCVKEITANEQVCKKHIDNSTATITALVSKIGYSKASEIVKLANEKQFSIKTTIIQMGLLTEEEFDELTSPEAVCRLGN
jgi:aspartate ammonia-lyase